MGRVVPLLVKLWTRNDEAVEMMNYYWDTTRTCVPPESILEAMRAAGMSDETREVYMGTFSEYVSVA